MTRAKHLAIVLAVFCFFSFTTLLNGQSNPNALIERDNSSLNPVLPSPEMASLGRFGGVDFEKSTGAPSLGIPIYTLNYDGVSIPLQLQFSSTGFRPSDIGGYLGMNWMLTGLGGISRQIKGQPDEQGYLINYINQSYINSIVPLAGSRAGEDSISQFNKGLDISQDSYTLSAINLNGKFFINSQKQYAFSVKKDIKLYHQFIGDTLSFWVMDTKGNRYEFNVSERTLIASHNGYSRATQTQDGITSWKLSKIITSGGKEILFNYVSYDYMVTNPSSDVYTSGNPNREPTETYNCGCQTTGTWSYGSNVYSYKTQIISSIVTEHETIHFFYATDLSAANYQRKLTGISVLDRWGQIKRKFAFDYGYYNGNTRLKLLSFSSIDVLNDAVEAKYDFSYYEQHVIPGPNTRNIDVGKYFNGSSNVHMLVASHSEYPFGSADRSIRSEFAQETLLKEVVYPTGGKTFFEYESNGNPSTNNLAAGIRTKRITHKDVNDHVANIQEYVYRNYTGPPLLINNVPPNTFPEMQLCDLWVFTSDNQYSTVQNTIPIPEDYYYGEVDVLDKNNSESLKTGYKYIQLDAMEGDLQVRPLEELVYKLEGGSYSLLKKKKYSYATKGYSEYAYGVLQFASLPSVMWASWDFGDGGFSWCVSVYSGVAQSQPRYQSVIRQFKVIDSTYEYGNIMSSTVEMGYGSYHELPLSIKNIDSKGETITRKLYYPSEADSLSNPSLSGGQLLLLSDMVSKNRIEYRISEEVYRSGQLVDGTRTTFGSYHSKYHLPNEIHDLDRGNGYVKVSDILNYDTSGNVLELRKEHDLTYAYVWGYNQLYPIAKVQNADYASIAYTSFEPESKGNWDYLNAGVLNGEGVTGNKAYSLSTANIQRTGLNTGIGYVLSYWHKNNSGSVSAGGTAMLSKNGWTLYQIELTGISSLTISGTGIVDELRLYPKNAQMTTFTYDPMYGITSQCDVNDRITYYEYDGVGRLILVRDRDLNILKSYNYQYKEVQ